MLNNRFIITSETRSILPWGKRVLSVDYEGHGVRWEVLSLRLFLLFLLLLLFLSKHMVVFLCIDYTIWPGWNHRGVYLYSREKEFKVKERRTLPLQRMKRRICNLYLNAGQDPKEALWQSSQADEDDIRQEGSIY